MNIARRSLIAATGLVLPAFTAQAAHAAGAKPRVTIQTSKGVIVIELEAEKAPLTSLNFLRYVDAHRYDGGTIYRASRAGGPGQGSIEGGPNEAARRFPPIPHESTAKTGLRHRAGTVSLARDAPGTGTGDFFICASPQPYLDAHPGGKGDNEGYAAFGQVVEGMGVVRAILAMPTNGKAQVAAMRGQMINPPVQIVGMKRA